MENSEVRMSNRAAMAKVLRWARRSVDLSQAQMADRLGVSLRTVSGWERNEAEIPATVVVEWMRLTDLPVDRLLAVCAPWDLNPEPADYLHERLVEAAA